MLIFDVETNGLLDEMDTIHCIVIKDTATKKVDVYDPQSKPIQAGVERLMKAKSICGHNIINFDIPAIQIVYPWFVPQGKLVDTLVMARVMYADIKGSDFDRHKKGKLPGNLIGRHSLEAYGFRLGALKDTFNKTTDWKAWSEEMSDYCVQDVLVTEQLAGKLNVRSTARWVQIEHRIAEILTKQEQHGVLFDINKAAKLHSQLLKERETVLKKIHSIVPPSFQPVKWNPNGMGKVFVPKRNNATRGYTEGAAMCHVEFKDFNPNSEAAIARTLTKLYGWQPVEFTDTGLPKCDEATLSQLPYPLIEPLLKYLLINKRLGQLVEGREGWLRHVNRETHRIHGAVNPNGAVTGRMAHFKPNLGQVPATYAPYGELCRELFTVPFGKKLVGIDASGIELRCLAHYMSRWDDGAYGKIILEGDIHTANMEALGISDRDVAKTFIYAFLYGAGKRKLAQILGLSIPKAAKAYAKFMEKLPAMNKLITAVKAKAEESGTLVGLDGRVLRVRSPHSALNTLLQSAGAVIMKEAQCILHDALEERFGPHGERWGFCLTVHDEWQLEVDEDIAEEVGKLGVKAIKKAGVNLSFRIPLDGEYKVGNNWKETH